MSAPRIPQPRKDFHEPGSADQPTPDPSREGNWPTGVAPLLGGAGGGFMVPIERGQVNAHRLITATQADNTAEEMTRLPCQSEMLLAGRL